MARIRQLLAVILAVGLLGCGLAGWGSQTVLAQSDELPRWASLRFDKTNMRVGPSREYPIAWVYQRRGLPVKVLRLRDEWELVEEPDGTRGWISGSQLSRERSAMITGEGLATLRAEPGAGAAIRWRAEPGVIGALRTCREGWCEIDVEGRRGWVEAARLWGDDDLGSPD